MEEEKTGLDRMEVDWEEERVVVWLKRMKENTNNVPYLLSWLSYNLYQVAAIKNMVKNEYLLGLGRAKENEWKHDQDSVTVTVLLQKGYLVWVKIRGPENAYLLWYPTLLTCNEAWSQGGIRIVLDGIFIAI